MTPQDIVQQYIDKGFKVVFWSATDDAKGPKQKDWPQKATNGGYTINDYHDGDRVGLLTGVEVEPQKWLHDVDIDWAPGSLIAQSLIPSTGFVFGRPSKHVSHCFYTLSNPVPTVRYEDIDKTCLIELRGTKLNGDVGMQTMAPPSIWSKSGQKEPLIFRSYQQPAYVDAAQLQRKVLLAATGMLLAKRLGYNGFGHENRLAWAGFLIKLGVSPDELIAMGTAMSAYCNNTEVDDVRRVVDSTVQNIAGNKKVKGAKALAAAIGKDGKAIISRILEWFGQNDFVRDGNGRIIAKNQDNIKRAITLLNHELRFNEFAATMLIDGQRLEDPQWKALYLEIDGQYGMQPPIDYFKMIVETMAMSNSFHPVKDYLESLTWDGEPRVDKWLITAARAEDTPYVRAISSIMLIAAVRRIRYPGCKYDEMVVWESPQGAEKSSAAQALCPHTDWFSDDLRLNLHAQQLIEATLGKWIVEASDLAGKRKTEIEQLKAMLSRQRDGPVRMAYAHFPVERPRHFILIGTTNSAAYLNDATGSRRFWPVAVKRFDMGWIRANRDQLWAEACVRESQGESIRLKEELWSYAGEEQEKRREIDPWEGPLREAIIAVEPGDGDKRRITTSALWAALNIPIERRDRLSAMRISEIMQRFGFKRSRVRPQGESVQVGYVQETDKLHIEEDEHRERQPGEDDEPF